MNNNIQLDYSLNLNNNYEIVERKGMGHPDTLADDLAERLSIAYSRYCLEHYGVILHHNFDKVGLMGGMSHVGFGTGKITSPIRVLINGRASSMFGDDKIDLAGMFENVVFVFFKDHFPHISNIRNIYKVIWEVSNGSSPGAICSEDSYRNRWFCPRHKNDLSELIHLNCNDTSMGCAFYGKTIAETIVLSVEHRLNSVDFKKGKPWLGSDIKLMCCRLDKDISLTLCVPQIGIYVNSINEYKSNIDLIREEILQIINNVAPDYNVSVNLNMRDRFDSSEKDLYLTYTGSSIEMGDEGFVGRGNRFGGVISPNRLYTMEGVAGKNPVYHTGKMYSAFAYELAESIFKQYALESEVLLIGMTGHSLMRPHRVIVKTTNNKIQNGIIEEIVNSLDPKDVTNKILNRYYCLF